jgi:hypothetical protein
MARPGWQERTKAARSLGQFNRFRHVINSDKVFGTHRGKITAYNQGNGQKGSVAVDHWRDELFRSGALDRDAKNPREPFRRLRDALACMQRIVERDGMVSIGYPTGIAPMVGAPSIVPRPGGNPLPPMPPFPNASPVAVTPSRERGVT